MYTIDERAVILGKYIIETHDTVRETAKMFCISKSTVHKDVTERLEKINRNLYEKVKAILEEHKEERHIRGGLATREKYLQIRKLLHSDNDVKK